MSTVTRLLLVAPVVLVSLSCASIEAGRPDDMVVFIVVDSSNSLPLPEVEVHLVTPSGVSLVGRTDESGRCAIGKEDIRDSKAMLVLFCTDYYFCGALQVDEDEILEYGEMLIHLAPFAV